MIKKIKKRFDETSHMMLFGIGLAACYWVLESLLLLFSETDMDLLQTLLQSDLSEISTRLIVLCLFVIFGSHAQYTINERKKAMRRMERDTATRERFQRLLSPDLAEMVVKNELKVEKGGQSRYATVMFADVCDFTRISEKYRAGEMLEMLNEYYEMIVEIVFRNGGTLDKFLGDGIMVFWGAPVTRPNDPDRAVRTALEMQTAIARFNRLRQAAGQERLQFGIGINTGYLVAGYIGSSRTMSYSVIGDTVNTTSRLCSAAGEGQILISADTWDLVQDEFRASKLDPIRVKGKRQPLTVFEVRSQDAS